MEKCFQPCLEYVSKVGANIRWCTILRHHLRRPFSEILNQAVKTHQGQAYFAKIISD